MDTVRKRVAAKLLKLCTRESPAQIPVYIHGEDHVSKALIAYDATGFGLQTKILRAKAVLRRTCAPILLLLVVLFSGTQAKGMQLVGPDEGRLTSSTIMHAGLPNLDEGIGRTPPLRISAVGKSSLEISPQLIVIGFMGGRVRGSNLIHREALLAKKLQESYPRRVYAAVFANHDAKDALTSVLHLLDENRDGSLSTDEKNAARIVIYGHSWGASETVAFARRLNALSIPVLLTIQVDSVQKLNENDRDIPPNVREAINFYQADGLLHGRSLIEAMNPKQTTILGNYESSYKDKPVSCANYPWFARTFMKSHIEIENDPSVWGKVAALIRAKLS